MSDPNPHPGMADDVVIACADLAARAGALSFNIGYANDDAPPEDADWYVEVMYRGTRVITERHRSPATAALAMAEKLLTGAECKCGRGVALTDAAPGCRWRLEGPRWTPGCTAPPVRITGRQGDLAAIRDAARQAQEPPR